MHGVAPISNLNSFYGRKLPAPKKSFPSSQQLELKATPCSAPRLLTGAGSPIGKVSTSQRFRLLAGSIVVWRQFAADLDRHSHHNRHSEAKELGPLVLRRPLFARFTPAHRRGWLHGPSSSDVERCPRGLVGPFAAFFHRTLATRWRDRSGKKALRAPCSICRSARKMLSGLIAIYISTNRLVSLCSITQVSSLGVLVTSSVTPSTATSSSDITR